MYETNLFKHDELLELTLVTGNKRTGQISLQDSWWFSAGEPMILAIREGASSEFTYIPWRSVESYRRV